jgi:type IV pilus assembly protein PilM
MVRTVGIDPGDNAVKVVELDGSYRKTKLLRVHAELVDEPAQRAQAVANAARAAVDEGMRGEVALAHPCREAVLRVIELPFKGHDAIRKVVKAEIEGEIHSHVVDDMVVDFHEIGAGAEGGTRVLVASVPKAPLRTQLQALAGNSIEPEIVDLDTMALWRAAHWAGAFEAPAGAEGAAAGMTAVVDLGARSVKVLIVDGEQLVEMRALRLGDASVVEEIARRNGLSYAVARDAVRNCLSTGGDHRLEVDESLPAAGGEAKEVQPSKRIVTVAFAEVEAAQTAFLQRLARELVRYLTSSGKAERIGALWITGGSCRMAGMREMLQEVFATEPRELDLLGHLQHELDPEVVADLGPGLAVAIGLALTKLGGPTGFDLRQEDLAYTRGFERIKFPMALACMVGLLALFVYTNKRSTELKNLELQIGKTYQKDSKSPVQFHGMLNSVFAGKWFENPQHFRWEQSKGKDYLYKNLVDELVATPVQKRIALVKNRLNEVVVQKQKESGVHEDITLESGLAVLVRFSQMIKAIEPQLGRYLLLKIDLEMKAPRRYLEFVVAFRGDDFRDKENAVKQALVAEYAKSDTPFQKPDKDESKEHLFKPDPSARGAYYVFRMGVKDSFDPYGPSAPNAIGVVDRPAKAGATETVAAADGEGKR